MAHHLDSLNRMYQFMEQGPVNPTFLRETMNRDLGAYASQVLSDLRKYEEETQQLAQRVNEESNRAVARLETDSAFLENMRNAATHLTNQQQAFQNIAGAALSASPKGME